MNLHYTVGLYLLAKMILTSRPAAHRAVTIRPIIASLDRRERPGVLNDSQDQGGVSIFQLINQLTNVLSHESIWVIDT